MKQRKNFENGTKIKCSKYVCWLINTGKMPGGFEISSKLLNDKRDEGDVE